MEVIVAKTAGFCFGVKRAVEQVYEQIETAKKPVYTYGPIIHNEFVVKDLEEKGVQVLNTEEELAALDGRNCHHPLPWRRESIFMSCLKAHHITVVDATCPFVKKIHRIVGAADLQRDAGSSSSEARNIRRCRASADGAMTRTLVVENAGADRESSGPGSGEKLCIVSQTTFNYKKFQDLVEKFEKKGYDILVLNTICNATQERQVEARRIASEGGCYDCHRRQA